VRQLLVSRTGYGVCGQLLALSHVQQKGAKSDQQSGDEADPQIEDPLGGCNGNQINW
jgi:hypothetical protein